MTTESQAHALVQAIQRGALDELDLIAMIDDFDRWLTHSDTDVARELSGRATNDDEPATCYYTGLTRSCGDCVDTHGNPMHCFEVSACPVCGDPDCTFPPECQDQLGEWPDPRWPAEVPEDAHLDDVGD